jgi:hypothetical protein
MRFMTLVKSRETAGLPPKALIEAIGKLGEETAVAGQLIDTRGLVPSIAGARVRLSGGKITVIDGPFRDAKEVIGAYAVFDFNSKQQAVAQTVRFMELHREYWPGWEGETEIRQLAAASGRGSTS